MTKIGMLAKIGLLELIVSIGQQVAHPLNLLLIFLSMGTMSSFLV